MLGQDFSPGLPWPLMYTVGAVIIVLISLATVPSQCRAMSLETMQQKQLANITASRIIERYRRKAALKSRLSSLPGSKDANKKSGGGEQKDIICAGGHFEVVGVLNSAEVFTLVVYDSEAKHHIMYFLHPDLVPLYVWSFTIPLNKAHVMSMREMLNFDPAIDKKKGLKISTVFSRKTNKENDDPKSKLLLFFYDPKATKDIDFVEVFASSAHYEKTDKSKDSVKKVAVMNIHEKGNLFFQCGDGGWCTADVEVTSGQSWFANQMRYKVGEAPVSGNKVLFIWVELEKDFPKGVKPVAWKNVNGLMDDYTHEVVLFADDYVYQYTDYYGQNRFLLSQEYITFNVTKFPVTEYFSCDGNIFPDRRRTPAPAQAKDGRLKTIYGLFIAHFLVATIMIVAIVIYTIIGKTGVSGKGGRSSQDRPKRVRKGRRTPQAKSSKSGIERSRSASKSAKNSKSSVERSRSASKSAKSATKSAKSASRNNKSAASKGPASQTKRSKSASHSAKSSGPK